MIVRACIFSAPARLSVDFRYPSALAAAVAHALRPTTHRTSITEGAIACFHGPRRTLCSNLATVHVAGTAA